MTTSSTNSSAPVPHSSPDRLRTWTGACGLAGFAMLSAFLVVSTQLGPDPLASTPSALARSLSHRSGAGLAAGVLAVSALSYVPLIGFFAGLRVLLSRCEESGLAASVVGIAAPLFLAGAVASDGFNLALVVAEHGVSALHASTETVQLLAAGWRVCLVEAQVALATVCLASGFAFLRGSTEKGIIEFPRWVGVWGVVGAVTVLPLVVAPGVAPIFALSNLTRLGWVLAVSVVALRSRHASSTR